MKDDGLAVTIMHATGMRVSECLALRRSDFIDHIDGKVMVHVSRQFQHGSREPLPLKCRKDFTGRHVPVIDSVAKLVKARPDGDLFTCNRRSFEARFATAARKAGLPRDFTPHQLRHHFVSTLLAGGIAITDVARWTGDTVRTIADTYAHLLPGQTDRALALLESDYAGKGKAQEVA